MPSTTGAPGRPCMHNIMWRFPRCQSVQRWCMRQNSHANSMYGHYGPMHAHVTCDRHAFYSCNFVVTTAAQIRPYAQCICTSLCTGPSLQYIHIAVRADVRERNGEKGEGEEDENQMFLLQVIIAPTCFGHKVGIL